VQQTEGLQNFTTTGNIARIRVKTYARFVSKQPTREEKYKYWKEVWYPKNKARHIAYAIEWNNKRREAIRTMLSKLKVERGCVDCGYNADPIALDFDHISDNKLFTISRAQRAGYSDEKIMAEVAKCEVVCSNCHRIRTRDRARSL
jgi:hypothetical protein